MIKLIVCDIDGTILKRDNTFDEVSFQKINELREKGIEFMFATGRDFEMVKDLCVQKDVYSNLILNNGTQYRSFDGETNLYYPMNKESFTKIIEILTDYGYHISVHTQQGKYIFGDVENYFQQHIELIKKSRHIKDINELPKAAFFTREGYLSHIHSVHNVEELYSEGALPLKIDARHIDPQRTRGVNQFLKVIPHLDISSSYEENIEITCDTYNKGTMLKAVLKQKGMAIDEVATFGDGLNDVAMLEGFPYSFAPENACQQAKEKAAYSLDVTNEQGAVKKGLEILEELNLL